MSDELFFDDTDADDGDEDEQESFETDPSVVAYLDQQGAAFEEGKQQFALMYGFDHDCHCATDYTDGKLAQVTECYLGLTDDALETCARLNWENQTLQSMLNTLVSMNDGLLTKITDLDPEFNTDDLLMAALTEVFDESGGPAIEGSEEEGSGVDGVEGTGSIEDLSERDGS